MNVKELPVEVKTELRRLGASAKLEVFLRVAYTVALEIVSAMVKQWPRLSWPTVHLEPEAVLTGIIGRTALEALAKAERKAALPSQLSLMAPNRLLEADRLEEMLLAVTETCLRGRRDLPLERRITRLLCELLDQPEVRIQQRFDDIVSSQNRHAKVRQAWMEGQLHVN